MCTVVLSLSPGAAWPLVLAANRDEMLDRPWDPPGDYWPERPGLVGGRDRLAGGTWMAMRGGMVAAVLNRPGSLGPADGFRSRGELPLMALAHASAAEAAAALGQERADAWRPFNLVIADADAAWLLTGHGTRTVEATKLAEGVSMITAIGLDAGETPRARRHLPRFLAAPRPTPEDHATWARLLGAADAEAGAGPRGGLTVLPDRGYGTVAASLVFLPAAGAAPVWLFAAGQAGLKPFAPVPLVPPAHRREARA
jgi:uncharacterized protein with NRDE domain